MKLTISDNSKNYTCTVVKIKNIFPIEGANNIVKTNINGNDVVVSKDIKVGDIMLYFVSGTKLNKDYCIKNNLLDKAEMNYDINKRGFISYKQFRVKAIKLKGIISDGMLMPLSSLEIFERISSGYDVPFYQYLKAGDEFTHIDDVMICEKYIVPVKIFNSSSKSPQKSVKISRLIDNQFYLHGDTDNLRKNMDKINPNDIIGIHYKKHGTSAVFGNILVKKNLKWYEKLVQKLGINVVDTEYDLVYSSRNVVKNGYLNSQTSRIYYKWDSLRSREKKTFVNNFYPNIKERNYKLYRNIFPLGDITVKSITLEHIEKSLPGFISYIKSLDSGYYGEDIWGVVAKEIGHLIPKGWNLYGEIIGYLPGGKAIQSMNGKPFDYGCKIGEHKFYVYKISVVNSDGKVIYLTDKQIEEWCEKVGLLYKDTFIYYGKAEDLYTDVNINQHWRENFLERLENEFNEKDCYMCTNKVPEEGMVLRVEKLDSYEAYKLKSKRFILMESETQEKDQINIEDNE